MSYAAQLLKRYRLEAGICQTDIARWLHLKGNQYISNVERGVAPFPLHWAPILIKKLIPKDELLRALRKDDDQKRLTRLQKPRRSRVMLTR